MSKKEYPYQNFSLKNIKGEKWKDIPGFEGEYQLSNYGRLKSLARWENYGESDRFRPGRIRKVRIIGDPATDMYMQLHRQGKRYSISVVRYVYYLFVTPFDFKDRSIVVSRKDGDILNCYYKNLVLKLFRDVAREGIETKRRKAPAQLQINPVTQYDPNSPHHYLNRNIENIRNEKWKAIKGFDGPYQISDHGRVKLLRYLKQVVTPGGNQTQVWTGGFIVKQGATKHYNHHIDEPIYSLSIKLSKGGNIRGFAVCRLVYQAFGRHSNALTTKIIMHKDGDNFNNHISNLHLASRTEVHKASYAKNRRKSHFASLTPEQKHEYQLRAIKSYKKPVIQYSLQNKRIASFDSLVAAAKATGVRSSGISSVLSGRSKTAGGFIWKKGKK